MKPGLKRLQSFPNLSLTPKARDLMKSMTFGGYKYIYIYIQYICNIECFDYYLINSWIS